MPQCQNTIIFITLGERIDYHAHWHLFSQEKSCCCAQLSNNTRDKQSLFQSSNLKLIQPY